MAAPRTETLTIFNMLPKRFFPPKALPVAVAPAPRGRRRRFAKLSSFVIVIAENRSASEASDSTPRQSRPHHVILMSSSIDASVITLHSPHAPPTGNRRPRTCNYPSPPHPHKPTPHPNPPP